MIWHMEQKGNIPFAIFLTKAMSPGAMPGVYTALKCNGKKFPLCMFITKAPCVKQHWLSSFSHVLSLKGQSFWWQK